MRMAKRSWVLLLFIKEKNINISQWPERSSPPVSLATGGSHAHVQTNRRQRGGLRLAQVHLLAGSGSLRSGSDSEERGRWLLKRQSAVRAAGAGRSETRQEINLAVLF